MSTSELVSPQHLKRKAIIYVRQSSPHLPIIAISGGGGGAAAADILEEAEFAGADICEGWRGFIDGAIGSGAGAAREVLQQLA